LCNYHTKSNDKSISKLEYKFNLEAIQESILYCEETSKSDKCNNPHDFSNTSRNFQISKCII